MRNEFSEINLDKFNAHPVNGWHNQFHLEMPRGLINDPNGLSVYRGEVHIFFQWNPFECEHRQKHWGLVKTTDFIHYSSPEIVLSPQDWFDKDGCYSGCATVVGDELQLYYTGNVKNELGQRESYQILARYTGEDICKKAVVIASQPEGYTAHFRDPFIYREGNVWYMLLGAQRSDLSGCVIMYQSPDGIAWTLLGELATSMRDFGYMWECPNLLNVEGDAYAFLFCPQGVQGQSSWLQSEHQSGYVIGTMDFLHPTISHGEFYLLDRGFDFYAPQVFTADGQPILIGWAGMPDKEAEYPTDQEGWRFSLTMPRLLSYRGGRLYQEPLPALQDLRGAILFHQEDGVLDDDFRLIVPKRSAEINCMIDIQAVPGVTLTFVCATDKIQVRYDKMAQQVYIDRTGMGNGGKGNRVFSLTAEETLTLQIFIDRSMLEIFYQNGSEVSTIAYFPVEKDAPLEFICSEKLPIKYFTAFELDQITFG